MRITCVLYLILIHLESVAQSDSSNILSLDSIVIRAYEQDQRLKEIPAAINYTGHDALARFSNSSIVSAINASPGVRMEERSPGSYRFNIRGSSLRSPFGVRNIKVYYNDIPVTDPGGITYLNQLGYYNFRSVEIIKGPGSSLYGAGTGGVMLIESTNVNGLKGAELNYTAGSFGSHNFHAAFTTLSSSNKAMMQTGFQHQQSDGYRKHSALRRDVFAWNGHFPIGNGKLKLSFLYGDLYYQTPGALIKAEYDANRKAARPQVGSVAGAESANAAVYQKQFIAGGSYHQTITSRIENRSVVYAMFTDMKNATIQNYSHNAEPHTGGRTLFIYKAKAGGSDVRIHLGGELQTGFAKIDIHKNVNGNADSLRSHDNINNLQAMLFTQASLQNNGWNISLGASLNFLKVKFERFSPASGGMQKRSFDNQLAPRISLMKKLGIMNIYAGVSRGFSPPTTSELFPTGGAVNLSLNAEHGINYDIGFKGTIKRVYVDVNVFTYSLANAIVLRRNAAGGDFYINAGGTKQFGIESLLSYPLVSKKLKAGSSLWLSHTWHDFHYRTFTQLTNDFSGNRMPSVSPHALSAGGDLRCTNGLIASVYYYYAGKIPLNDANTAYADEYHLVGAQLGYSLRLRSLNFNFVGGIENLLDEEYSLGNDVNGFGGRYYNAAASRSFYVQVAIRSGRSQRPER